MIGVLSDLAPCAPYNGEYPDFYGVIMKIKLRGCDAITELDLGEITQEQKEILEKIAKESFEYSEARYACYPNLIIVEENGK